MCGKNFQIIEFKLLENALIRGIFTNALPQQQKGVE